MFLTLCAYGFVNVVGDEKILDTSAVIPLTDQTFDELIKDGIWVIKFFAPWCGHCRKLAPIWGQYAEVAKGIYHVAEVDCTNEKGLAKRFSITGYPTLKMFENGKFVADMNVPRNIKDFVWFVESRSTIQNIKGKIILQPEIEPSKIPKDDIKSEVVALDNMEFIQKGVWMVKFYAPWCGHCKKLAPVWNELAIAQKKEQKFQVGEVDCSQNEALCATYSITGYPTVLMYIFILLLLIPLFRKGLEMERIP